MIARLAMVLACVGPNGGLAAGPNLDSLASIRALAPSEAEQAHPASVEATVTFPDNEGFFIHDGVEGIFLRCTDEDRKALNARAGVRLSVEGETTPGGFIPDLNCLRYEILGEAALPEPQPVSLDNLFSPALDCQWVEVPAVITGAEGQVENHYALTVEVFGWTLKILVPHEPDTAEKVSSLVQQRVTFRAVAATVYNNQRQMTGRYFLMPSLDFISPVGGQMAQSTVHEVEVEDLLRSDVTSLTPVRVRGVVTGAREGELFLRGRGGSLRVSAASASDYSPGDQVEAEGFAAIAPFRPILRARQLTRIGKGPPPAPLEPGLAVTNLIALPTELLVVKAKLLGMREEPAARVLQCQRGDQFFEAVVPLEVPIPESLTPGSIVRLIGNCELVTSHPLPRSQWVEGFRLHLRDAADLAVLTPAPWWTWERLVIASTLIGAVTVAILLWNLALRRRVRVQTGIIGSQIEREATLHERHRIARDLHDSFEQEMTGVAIQLRNARHSLKDGPDKVGEAISLAEQMIRHCRQEARTSIRDLRSVALEQGGLEGAIRDLLAPLATEAGVGFSLQVLGAARRMEFHLENDLLRVAQEATSNALHHAAPTKIEITLEYTPDVLRLTVGDDGCGFDPSTVPPRGHFGLLGMQERSNQRQGSLTIESQPGGGTEVKLEVPVAAAELGRQRESAA